MSGDTHIQQTVREAIALRDSGQFQKALEILEAAGEHNATSYALRGEIEFALNRLHEASLSYTAAVVSDSNDARTHYSLGLCLVRLERWEAASSAFQKALRLDPQLSRARLGLASSLMHLDRSEEALFILGSEAEGCAEFGRAVALQLLGRFDQARSVYEHVLVSNPESAEALSNLIAMGLASGDIECARTYASRLLALNPRSPAALQGLATVAFHEGDNRAAARYCDRIIEADPHCAEAAHNFGIATDRIMSGSRTPARPSPSRQ